MNNMQKVLIQASFQRVLAIADVAAELFYGRLFELDPALRPMFRGDMATQGKKLMNALKLIVNGLDKLEQLVPALEALARRHVNYGVTDEHYETVGAALIWTLQRGLGDSFTPSVAAACPRPSAFGWRTNTQSMSSGLTACTVASRSGLFDFSSASSSSKVESKWSSIARLCRPVTKIICRMPAA